MTLLELRCKQDHVPNSTVQILFKRKCKIEREKEIGRQKVGKRERQLEREERLGKRCYYHIDSCSILLVLLHLGLWWWLILWAQCFENVTAFLKSSLS